MRLTLPSFEIKPEIRLPRFLAGFGLLSVFAFGHVSAEEERPSKPDASAVGALIYNKHCVACHGGEGQGTDEFYPAYLEGDASIGELATIIAETMPEEDPDLCVGDDALAVAKFVHEEFYGEAAQLRRRPPQQSLSRLTGDQLRRSLSDLYTHFFSQPYLSERGGLSGSYFAGKRWKKENLKYERVDKRLDFDFGHEGPGGEIKPEEFYIHWSGGVIPPHSGTYEIVVRSKTSFVLKFGHSGRSLIDNHVQSQGREEFRRTLVLDGGQPYLVNIDFHQRKRKTEQPPADFSLRWVPPGGVEEVIPSIYLQPHEPPPAFSLQTPLPPDDRSYGYERGTSVDRAFEDAVTSAALEFANVAIEEIYPQYRRRHRNDPNDDRQILRGFLAEFYQVAFRRKLDDAMKSHFIDKLVDATPNDADAIKLTCLLALKSPRFLYPSIDSDRDHSARVASRLTLTMFDSLPSDQWLLQMIEKNQLVQPNQIDKALWRMTNDPRTRAKIKSFLYHYLELTPDSDLSKDREAFPEFDEDLIQLLRQSMDRQIESWIASEAMDFRELWQMDRVWTTKRLSEFYGQSWQTDEALVKADDEDEGEQLWNLSVSDSIQHAGLLTHPLLMAKMAYSRTTSPIHRGVYLTRHAMGRVLRPPNEAFTPINPDLHPGLTTRQRVELQTGEVNCQVCHSKINALGFALENFDAVGRFRDVENEKTVDASGNYIARNGQTYEFEGGRQLADYISGSPDAVDAFVEALFEYFVKQPVDAFGESTRAQLTESFVDSNYSVKGLIHRIAKIAASIPQSPPEQQASSRRQDDAAKAS
ncbi:MAG: DUF1588 domain-containing protein [Planctomycetota bacterium]